MVNANGEKRKQGVERQVPLDAEVAESKPQFGLSTELDGVARDGEVAGDADEARPGLLRMSIEMRSGVGKGSGGARRPGGNHRRIGPKLAYLPQPTKDAHCPSMDMKRMRDWTASP